MFFLNSLSDSATTNRNNELSTYTCMKMMMIIKIINVKEKEKKENNKKKTKYMEDRDFFSSPKIYKTIEYSAFLHASVCQVEK